MGILKSPNMLGNEAYMTHLWLHFMNSLFKNFSLLFKCLYDKKHGVTHYGSPPDVNTSYEYDEAMPTTPSWPVDGTMNQSHPFFSMNESSAHNTMLHGPAAYPMDLASYYESDSYDMASDVSEDAQRDWQRLQAHFCLTNDSHPSYAYDQDGSSEESKVGLYTRLLLKSSEQR